MSHAAGQFRNFGHKNVIFVAPVCNSGEAGYGLLSTQTAKRAFISLIHEILDFEFLLPYSVGFKPVKFNSFHLTGGKRLLHLSLHL